MIESDEHFTPDKSLRQRRIATAESLGFSHRTARDRYDIVEAYVLQTTRAGHQRTDETGHCTGPIKPGGNKQAGKKRRNKKKVKPACPYESFRWYET